MDKPTYSNCCVCGRTTDEGRDYCYQCLMGFKDMHDSQQNRANKLQAENTRLKELVAKLTMHDFSFKDIAPRGGNDRA